MIFMLVYWGEPHFEHQRRDGSPQASPYRVQSLQCRIWKANAAHCAAAIAAIKAICNAIAFQIKVFSLPSTERRVWGKVSIKARCVAGWSWLFAPLLMWVADKNF
jgi:hypothetical protein